MNPIYNCICCRKELTESYHIDDNRVESYNQPIANGLIDRVEAGFGSKHDMSVFILVICDECIYSKINSGVLIKLK